MTTKNNFSLSYFNLSVVIFLAYLFSALFGLGVQSVAGHITLVWPPSGIAFATFLLMGNRYIPAIFGAAFLANFILAKTVTLPLVIATGNTFGFLLSALLIKKLTNFNPGLYKVKDVILFTFMGALIGATLSSLNGVFWLWVLDVIESEFVYAWSMWFVGDALGVLIFGSLLTVLISNNRTYAVTARIIEELLAIALSLLLISLLIMTDASVASGFRSYTLYLAFVPLVWAALRYGIRGAVLVSVFFFLAIAWSIMSNRSMSQPDIFIDHLITIQLFVATYSIIGMIIGSMSEERIISRRENQKIIAGSVVSCNVNLLPDGTIISFDSGFEQITGYRTLDWIGKSFLSMLSEQDAPAQMINIHSAANGDIVDGGFVFVRRLLDPPAQARLTITPVIKRGVVVFMVATFEIK